MKIRHNALYYDLLNDLSDHLPSVPKGCTNEVQFYKDMKYWPDMTTAEFRALHLVKSFYKKFVDSTSPNANGVALRTFLQSNMVCKNYSHDLSKLSLKEEMLLGYFREEVWRFFNFDNLSPVMAHASQLAEGGKTGPGASIGARGNDFYTKLFDSPLTCTSRGIYEIYSHYMCKFPSWSNAESQRHDEHGEYQVVTGNRLTFVPKSVDTSRVICIEPNLNMFLQQGLRAVLERRLRQYFRIDLSTQQECNRDLARVGSKNDSYSTIDLSSASDTIAHSMIKEFFPRDFVAWLELLRSPSVTLPDGRVEKLHMISSMGNAFTFPLETIIFACAVSAAYRLGEIPLRKGYTTVCKAVDDDSAVSFEKKLPNFGVFGDDIICRKDTYKNIVGLLNILGFTVNAEKSFQEGPFRESCGGDYFHGHQVRGVYLKALGTQASRFVAINRLNLWTATSGIPLQQTIGRLVKSVRWLPVPLHENDDAGIKVPLDCAGKVKMDPMTQSVKYRLWSAIPSKLTLPEGEILSPRNVKKRNYNASALLLAFLRGDIKCGSMTIRLGSPRYATKVAISPNWDYSPTIEGEENPSIGQCWLAASIRTNLNN